MTQKKVISPYPLLMPVPAAVVSIAAGDERNLITISWIGVVCSDPPMIGFSVRKNRHSYDLLEKAEDFVVNIPCRENLEVVDICGRHSGRDLDKFDIRGVTAKEAKQVKSPIISEFPVNLECKLSKKIELGSHTQYIGEVVKTHVISTMLDDKNNVMIGVVNPVCYVPKASTYYNLSNPLAEAGYATVERKGSRTIEE